MIDTRNIAKYAKAGSFDRYWYQTCHSELKELFPEADMRIICDFLAATSMKTSIKGNVLNFFKAYHQYTHNLPFTGFMHNVRLYLEYSAAGQEFPDSGRKVKNFTKAMQGQEDAIVVDIWVMRAFGLKAGQGKGAREVPTRKQYDAIEEHFMWMSDATGWQPRELCAAVWSGIRTMTTKSRITGYPQLIRASMNQLKLDL